MRNVPKILNDTNIDNAIKSYHGYIKSIPLNFTESDLMSLLLKLKREPINTGPYPHVTFFEAANRIMTDLTILYGIKELLEGRVEALMFDYYEVEYGNENQNAHDITAKNSSQELKGEAFNVSKSFFQGKKHSSLRKLRGKQQDNDLILLLYNSDAVNTSYKPKLRSNEYHLQVDIQGKFREFHNS